MWHLFCDCAIFSPDKTKNLLFDGSKKVTTNTGAVPTMPVPCMSEMQDLDSGNINRSELHLQPGQLHIDSQGYLCGASSRTPAAKPVSVFNSGLFGQQPIACLSQGDARMEEGPGGSCSMECDLPGPSTTNAFSVLMGSARASPQGNVAVTLVKVVCECCKLQTMCRGG